jgi:hypothetical protein
MPVSGMIVHASVVVGFAPPAAAVTRATITSLGREGRKHSRGRNGQGQTHCSDVIRKTVCRHFDLSFAKLGSSYGQMDAVGPPMERAGTVTGRVSALHKN